MSQYKKIRISILIIIIIRYIANILVIAPILKYKIINDKGAIYIYKN